MGEYLGRALAAHPELSVVNAARRGCPLPNVEAEVQLSIPTEPVGQELLRAALMRCASSWPLARPGWSGSPCRRRRTPAMTPGSAGSGGIANAPCCMPSSVKARWLARAQRDGSRPRTRVPTGRVGLSVQNVDVDRDDRARQEQDAVETLSLVLPRGVTADSDVRLDHRRFGVDDEIAE